MAKAISAVAIDRLMPKHKRHGKADLAQQDKRDEFRGGNQATGKNIEHDKDVKIGYI